MLTEYFIFRVLYFHIATAFGQQRQLQNHRKSNNSQRVRVHQAERAAGRLSSASLQGLAVLQDHTLPALRAVPGYP